MPPYSLYEAILRLNAVLAPLVSANNEKRPYNPITKATSITA